MGLLLPHRWPLTYSQWWECDFVTEGIIDSGESSPLPGVSCVGVQLSGCLRCPSCYGSGSPLLCKH